MLSRLLAFLGALVLAAGAAAQNLPANSANQNMVGMTFVYGMSASAYSAIGTASVPVKHIWDNTPVSTQGGSGVFNPAATFSSAYNAVVRVPSFGRTYGGNTVVPSDPSCVPAGRCNLAWFQSNHPSWVLYKADQVTPAYYFNDTSYIPINVLTNSATRSWFFTYVLSPEYSAGYSSASFDNIGLTNDALIAGTCSIKPTTNCTADGGTWTTLYTGANDPAFGNDVISWLTAATAFAHTNFPGKSTTGNIAVIGSGVLTDARLASLIAAVDVWYDEDGISGDYQPASCLPAGNGSGSVGQGWIDKVTFITGLNGGAGPNAYVANNNICPFNTFGQMYEQTEWVVASMMILKNGHTYNAPNFPDGSNFTASVTGNILTVTAMAAGTITPGYDTYYPGFVVPGATVLPYGTGGTSGTGTTGTYQITHQNGFGDFPSTAGFFQQGTACQANTFCLFAYPATLLPQFTLNHGAPSGPFSVVGGVYTRDFANAKAVVNPSTTTPQTFNFGALTWHRSNCQTFTGTVTIPPVTGYVLLPGAAAGCVP